MCRDDVIFDLHYSYFLENMFSTLMGRMDKTMSLFLIVLGGTAFAPFSNAFIFGVSVATLSAAQFIFQPESRRVFRLSTQKIPPTHQHL